MTLLSHERCYEIRIIRNLDRMSLHDLCAYVLSAILYVFKSLYNNLSPCIAFQCPCPDHKTNRGINHLCVLNEDLWGSVSLWKEISHPQERPGSLAWKG